MSLARLSKNAVLIFLARFTDAVMRLVLFAIIAAYLPTELFGEFVWVVALVAFLLPLSNFGIDHIIVKKISSDMENAGRHVGSALVLRVVLSIVLVVLVFTIIYVLHLKHRIALAVCIAMCSQIFISFGLIFIGVFRGFERMGYEALLTFIYQLIKVTSVIVVVKFDLGFLFIFLAMAFADLSKMILQTVIVLWKFLRPHLSIDINHCKILLRESYPLAIFAFLSVSILKLDIFILRYFRGPIDVALFEIPHRIIMSFRILPMSVTIALFPVFSRLAKSSMSTLEYTYQKVFKILLVLSLPIAILLTIWAKEIIAVFFKGYLDAYLALQLLAGMTCLLFLIGLANIALISAGKQNICAVGAGICFCVNLIMDLILVPKYGYIGASIGTLVAYLCFFFVTLYFVSKVIGRVPIISIAFKPIICGFLMFFGFFIFQGNSLPGFALDVIIGISCYVFALIILKVFTADELNLLRMAVKRG